MTPEPATYPGYRFPAEVIRHAMWLYHLFSLSLRDIELILAERGILVTHESIRRWVLKFGTEFAGRLRKRRPRPGDTWHLDGMFLKVNGELHYLWRAVDQNGVVLDIPVQPRRNASAATRFFKRLLKELRYKPKRLVTDGLRSYGVAHREVMPEVRHRVSDTSTIGRRTRTGPRGAESARCSASCVDGACGARGSSAISGRRRPISASAWTNAERVRNGRQNRRL
ncbi:IS6 family transposase [Muricoccus pecuniae]|uniref:Transposase-like protein n=1 Tax=Muricoccus pecuniae TaxID=693023 RepID=A0A840Y682_9PROT|nr:IS6 family transposase [Roseomonas pecuniae]MBB5696245.1 transposase-like protein [Roseomonas pecuniae]